jgi:asparagine synthase (glutamine-hydrolysing)
MSVQFGRWNFDGALVEPDCINSARSALAAYGPDGEGSYCAEAVRVIYRAFHTTEEAAPVTQPYKSRSGVVITWDGRLDNREDLVRELQGGATLADNDVSIVAAAYDHWETKCFERLIGDWAVSIWNPREKLLILAKDFIGTRPLYYSIERNGIQWSTILDPLVPSDRRTFSLEEEYLAGWFGSLPAAHLTPYVGIEDVPAACFVTITPRRSAVQKYWDFDGSKRIRYHRDADYEEHFRTVLAHAVRRRLRSHTPILAELSGGMDSSAIVCMADSLTPAGPKIDTVSYYADCEPSWDE